MPEPRIWRNTVRENGSLFHRARITDRDGNVSVQGDFTGLATIQVYDVSGADADTVIFSNVTNVSSILTNTLQLPWPDGDGIGWNLEVEVTSNQVVREGGHTYRTEVTLTHLVEGDVTTVFENLAKGLRRA